MPVADNFYNFYSITYSHINTTKLWYFTVSYDNNEDISSFDKENFNTNYCYKLPRNINPHKPTRNIVAAGTRSYPDAF